MGDYSFIDEHIYCSSSCGVNASDALGYDVSCTCGAEKAKQQLIKGFEKLMLEVIGEPEYRETEDMSLKSWTKEDYKAFGRNELRAEQRQALKSIGVNNE